MKAALIWTINEFPTYEMVFSWSILRKLVCPYYMENKKVFTILNGGKMFFFFHWRFLTTNHKYRKNKNDFFVSRVERDFVLSVLYGEELYGMDVKGRQRTT